MDERILSDTGPPRRVKGFPMVDSEGSRNYYALEELKPELPLKPNAYSKPVIRAS